jgi:hypothetical protein
MVTARKRSTTSTPATRKTARRPAAARASDMQRKIDKIIKRRASALRELN